MLQNAYLLAKIGADTAENERFFAENLPRTGNYPTGPPPCGPAVHGVDGPGPLPGRAHGHGADREGADGGGSPISKIGNIIICKFLQIFSRLVLGCIKTKFRKKICVWQHFSSSTRFAHFCTAAISKFEQKIGLKNQQFSWNVQHLFCKCCKICKILSNFKNCS